MPRPSVNPAERATTFLRAPQSSTDGTSGTTFTLKVFVLKSWRKSSPRVASVAPTVASQKSPRATSLALALNLPAYLPT